MPEVIRRAALCIFPSYAEALPMAWLEAMACGQPVIGYDVGWAREIVDPGRTGLLVPAGNVDGLVQGARALLLERERAAAFAAAARQEVENRFTPSVVVAQLERWVEEHRARDRRVASARRRVESARTTAP
jgi:glycosyltransferase involved in cell wall biosynthesis